MNLNFPISRLMFILLAIFTSLQASSQVTGHCGTTIADQLQMHKMFSHYYGDDTPASRNEKVYVPVKFHLLADTDGRGRIDEAAVLNQLCALNRDFASLNIVFYIFNGFAYFDATGPYEAPGSNGQVLNTRKDPQALNIFICKTADTGNSQQPGTTLGYYSPNFDYVVVRQQEVRAANNTLSHEVGHFFSLRHTFFGWENIPYDEAVHGNPVTLINAPGTSIPVEIVERTNCQTAADQICDTQPDYNFGFGASNCNWSRQILDRNGVLIVPPATNQMGYFLTCNTYQFSDQQGSRMINNFNSPARAYLRRSFVPNTDTIRSAPVVITPMNQERVETYNGVLFDWEDVPNASRYLFTITDNLTFTYSEILNGSETYLTNLSRNRPYFWSVTPFNDGYSCGTTTTSFMRTGTQVTSTFDPSIFSSVTVFPNPTQQSSEVQVLFDAIKSTIINISMIDQLGRKVNTYGNFDLTQGANKFSLPIDNVENGAYILQFISEGKVSHTKLIIQK